MSKMQPFAGKTVVITGATSGIGLACALAFGAAGANMVITGRNPENLKAAETNLQQNGIPVLAVQADVSSEADCRRMATEAVTAFGGIDVLVNNAGLSMRVLFQDLEFSVIRKLMEVNFFGTVFATHACLSYIIKSKGTVVGISSVAGIRGLPGRTGYSASKFAMNGFLEALRTELMYQGVNVLTVCPGFTASNIRNTALGSQGTPIGETSMDEASMMSADEVASEVLKAVLGRKRGITLTFQGKLTAFLNKWIPGIMDTLVFNTIAKEKDSPLQYINRNGAR